MSVVADAGLVVPQRRAARLLHIDGARGYLLIMMYVAHFGFIHHTPVLNFHHGSFSAVWDGEFFVLLSGFVCALSYGGVFKREGLRACFMSILRRLRWVYLYQVLVSLLTLYLFYLAWPLQLSPEYTVDPNTFSLTTLAQVFTFVEHPPYLGILILYIVLMLFIPVAAWLLHHQQQPLFFAIIIGCWICATHGFDARMISWFQNNLFDPSQIFSLRDYFNPLSYAIVFYGGYYLGHVYKRDGQAAFRKNTLPLSSSAFALSIGVMIVFAVAELFRAELGTPIWFYDPTRDNITITGLLDTAAMAYVVYFLLAKENLPLPLEKVREFFDMVLKSHILVAVGQSSLFVYSAHVIVVFLSSYFILSAGYQNDPIMITMSLCLSVWFLIVLSLCKRQYLPSLP